MMAGPRPEFTLEGYDAIGEKVLLTSGSITTAVQRLERKDLVRRERSTGMSERASEWAASKGVLFPARPPLRIPLYLDVPPRCGREGRSHDRP